MTFKIGDRVRVATGAWAGMTGTVRKVFSSGSIASLAVELDGHESGHDCGGVCSAGGGRWIKPERLALIPYHIAENERFLAIASYYDAVTRLGERE